MAHLMFVWYYYVFIDKKLFYKFLIKFKLRANLFLPPNTIEMEKISIHFNISISAEPLVCFPENFSSMEVNIKRH